MDTETTQESPGLLPIDSNNNNNNSSSNIPQNIKEESPRQPFGGDRLKRDEWSEGAVSSLLEAYENKWILRNRAKLKGHDWEDVARHVSSRANFSKSPKTQTQCKNKIESMKKRYRSESATAEASSWPLYSRLDLLLRGTAATTAATTSVAAAAAAAPPQQQQSHLLPSTNAPPLKSLEPSPILVTQPPPPPVVPPAPFVPPAPPPPPLPVLVTAQQNSHGSNGVDREAKDDGTKSSHHVSDKHGMDHTDSSTPALYSDKEKKRSKKLKMRGEARKKRKRRDQEWEIADSIRWLAEVVVRSEQARMDTMRELEKMRIEAEAKRGEMDLKRTEIIANTQLEIAKLFAGVSKGGVDSSLRIGRN